MGDATAQSYDQPPAGVGRVDRSRTAAALRRGALRERLVRARDYEGHRRRIRPAIDARPMDGVGRHRWAGAGPRRLRRPAAHPPVPHIGRGNIPGWRRGRFSSDVVHLPLSDGGGGRTARFGTVAVGSRPVERSRLCMILIRSSERGGTTPPGRWSPGGGRWRIAPAGSCVWVGAGDRRAARWSSRDRVPQPASGPAGRGRLVESRRLR